MLKDFTILGWVLDCWVRCSQVGEPWQEIVAAARKICWCEGVGTFESMGVGELVWAGSS